MTTSAIEFVEAAYDLSLEGSDWLPALLEAGLPMIDQGLGAAGILYGRPLDGGPVELQQIHVASGRPDFPKLHGRAIAATPPDVLRHQARPGLAATMSENTADTPEALELYTSYVDYCRDLLGITAVDHTGSGVAIVAPLKEVTRLSGRAKERWQMLAAHVSAGHRLRSGIALGRSTGDGELPHHAEAVLDTNAFAVVDAEGEAKTASATEVLRAAALRTDRARGGLRRSNPGEALETWTALVQGRWSMVDWFDTDGRRYILAVPNEPNVVDPRGLTRREVQVVSYAMFGHTNKMIAYQLGISRPRVSGLLSAAMRKLGVRNRSELIRKMRDMRELGPYSGDGSGRSN